MSPKELVTNKVLCERYGIGPIALWKWRKKKGFPEPIPLTQRVLVWRWEDIIAWEESQGV